MFSAFLALSYSCSKTDDNIVYVDSFPEEKTVVAKDAKWLQPYNYHGMLMVDSLLVISNVKGPHPAFQVYNANSLSLVKEGGTFGRGPEEFLSAASLTGQFFKDKKTSERFFYAYSTGRKVFYTVSLDKLLQGRPFVVKKNKLSKQLWNQSFLLKVGHSLIGNSPGTKGKTFCYDLDNTEKIDKWDYYPEIDNISQFSDQQRYSLNQKSWAFNPRKQLLAGATGTYFNRLIYCTPEGKRVKVVSLPQKEIKLTKHNYDNFPDYAGIIIASGNNIYRVY
ncbi:MAG: hypothetical protein MI784_06640 [Cytophagales bacterium]|nr:hypothetical protein [Cytophagales bacterium]